MESVVNQSFWEVCQLAIPRRGKEERIVFSGSLFVPYSCIAKHDCGVSYSVMAAHQRLNNGPMVEGELRFGEWLQLFVASSDLAPQ
jgi:hypothetical protein